MQRRKSEKRKPPRARRAKILNYQEWPRRPCRNSMNRVTYKNVIRTSPGGAYAHMRIHDGEIEVPTHTHTHTHIFESQVKKKVPPKEVPGYVGALTQIHTSTRLSIPDRARRIRMGETSTHTHTHESNHRKTPLEKCRSHRNHTHTHTNKTAN